MKKNFVFFCVVFAVLFTACSNLFVKGTDKDKSSNTQQGGNNNGGTDTSVSFDNFKTRSVSVKNNTGERLIAFKGAIEPASLISGVPANASNHGLRMDESLFSATSDFALLFLTEKVYNENKNNLAAVKNSPFASIYAFYNKTGSNDLVYTISSNSGGNAKLILQNNSAFNVEIRCNSPEGEVLGYVGAYTANTVLNVQPADYTFYPVFKKYIARDNEIYSIVPKFISSGKPYARDITIENEESWNVGEVWDSSAMQLSSGGFYLTIINNAETAVRFKKGTQEFESSMGFKGINSGKQVTFFVPFERQKDPQGGYLGYPEEVELAVLTIGSALFPNKLPKHTYKLDTKYTITIEGAQQDNLTLSAIKEVGKVDINKLFGL